MDTFKRDIAKLAGTDFDVVIVGGGISGAWLALHCARSGYQTALLEQNDYASQTSSSSSKLLHGGIRYLQQFQFGKVRESAMERAHFIYAAPHLSKPVPFLIPTYRDFQRSKFFLNCGMRAYRLLTLGENRIIGDPDEILPPISSLKKTELDDVLDLGSEPHTGAVQFFERHMVNSERMVLAVLRSAADAGAQICNYCSALELQRQNQTVTGLVARDEVANTELEISARLVINAAGPWIDELNSQANNKPASINGFAVGSHLITRRISERAIALTTKHQSETKLDRGGRHVFVIPWNGHSLIGTSYEEIEEPQRDLSPQASHVEQLLEAVNEALPTAKLTSKDVVSGYSGLYPLRTENIENTVYQGSGEYVVVDHADADGIDGLLTALGAKYTTGRKLSALTMKRVQKKLGGSLNLSKVRLSSSNYDSFIDFHRLTTQQHSQLSEATLTHLAHQYGSDATDLLALAKEDSSLQQPISTQQPDINAQILYAVQYEQARTLMDVLFRRTSVGLFPITHDEVHAAGQIMARAMSWNSAESDRQVDAVMARIQHVRKNIDAASISAGG